MGMLVSSPVQSTASQFGSSPTLPQRALHSLAEGQAILGNPSRATIYRWERQGLIELVRIGGRTFIPAREIARLTAGEVA